MSVTPRLRPPSAFIGSLRQTHPAAILALLLLLVFLRWVPHNYRPMVSSDSGVFLYIGQQLNVGLSLYTELWDHKGPLLFYLNAAGLRLASGSPGGVLALDYLSVLVFFVLCWRILFRHFGLYPALLASVMVLNLLPELLPLPDLTECYALPLQAVSFYLLLTEFSHGFRCRYPIAQGVATALLAQLRPNLVGAGVVYMLITFILLGKEHSWRESLARIGLFTVAFTVCGLAFVYPFYRAGTLNEYWFGLVGFNLRYSGSGSFLMRARALYDGLYRLNLFGASGVALCVCICMVKTRPSWNTAHGRLAQCGALLFVSECALSSVSGQSYQHYDLMWLLPLAVLSAFVWSQCEAGPTANSSGRLVDLGRLVRVACLVGVGFSILGSARLFYQRYGSYEDGSAKVIASVKRLAGPSDRVFVWGSRDLDIMFRLNLRPASRFFHTTPMWSGERSYLQLATWALQDLAASNSAFVVEVQEGGWPKLFSREDLGCSVGSAPALLPNHAPLTDDVELADLKRTLSTKYEVAFADLKERIIVYRLKGLT